MSHSSGVLARGRVGLVFCHPIASSHTPASSPTRLALIKRRLGIITHWSNFMWDGGRALSTYEKWQTVNGCPNLFSGSFGISCWLEFGKLFFSLMTSMFSWRPTSLFTKFDENMIQTTTSELLKNYLFKTVIRFLSLYPHFRDKFMVFKAVPD